MLFLSSFLPRINNHFVFSYFRDDTDAQSLVHHSLVWRNFVSVPFQMDFLQYASNFPEHFLETRRNKSELAWSSEPSQHWERAQRSLLKVRRVDYYIALLICNGYAFIHVWLALPFQH